MLHSVADKEPLFIKMENSGRGFIQQVLTW